MFLKLTKTCTECLLEKPLEAFHKDARSKTGRTSKCASCRTERQKAVQEKQKLEKPEHYRRWRKSNNYSSKYGLTLEEVEAKLRLQHSICPICECSLDLNSWAVDHCHTTGKVRDILCSSCNKGLGFFYESPEALQNAISYLKKHNDPSY